MTFERVEKMAQELAVFRDQNRAATSNRAIPHEEVEHAAVFLDAYLNMLQYQRIKVVNQYQADYDFLAYSMRRDHSKLAIDHVTPVKLEQPRESGDVGSYLADAADAKRILDAEVLAVVEAERAAGGELRPVKAPSFVEAPLKSEESTLRKASMPWAGGNLRLVTDMARVSVLCYSSEDLQKMCQNLRERFKVTYPYVPYGASPAKPLSPIVCAADEPGFCCITGFTDPVRTLICARTHALRIVPIDPGPWLCCAEGSQRLSRQLHPGWIS